MRTAEEAEKLVADVKSVVRDAENVLKATVNDASDKARDARARLEETMRTARESCRRLEDKVVAGAKAADVLAHAHPYSAMAVAFGVGLALGVLLTRK